MSTDAPQTDPIADIWRDQLADLGKTDAEFKEYMAAANAQTGRVISEMVSKLSGVATTATPNPVLQELTELLMQNQPVIPFILDFAKKLISRVQQAAQEEAAKVMNAVNSS